MWQADSGRSANLRQFKSRLYIGDKKNYKSKAKKKYTLESQSPKYKEGRVGWEGDMGIIIIIITLNKKEISHCT